MSITQTLAWPTRLNNRYSASPVGAGGYEQSSVYEEAATQSWVAGAFVYLSSGNVTLWPGGAAILGQAMNAATGTTGAPVKNLVIIRPGDRYLMNLYSATPSSAVPARTQIGNRYKLDIQSSVAVCNVDVTAVDAGTPLPWVKVVDIRQEDIAAGNTYGFVIVEFGLFSNNTGTGVLTHWLQGAA